MDIVDFDSLLTCLTFETVSRGYCVNSTHRENQKAWKGLRCLVMAAHSRILFLLGEQAHPLRELPAMQVLRFFCFLFFNLLVCFVCFGACFCKRVKPSTHRVHCVFGQCHIVSLIHTNHTHKLYPVDPDLKWGKHETKIR